MKKTDELKAFDLQVNILLGTGVAEGYVDYPTLAEMETAAV